MRRAVEPSQELEVGRATPRAPRLVSAGMARRGPTRPPLSTPAQRAFSLVEIMVVLVLMGILTAMIIPEMRGTFEDALLRSASRELVSVFELASSRAVSLNQSLRVRLDTADGRYQIERLVRDGAREDFVPLTGVAGTAGRLDQRISVEVRGAGGSEREPQTPGHGTAIVFNPDGTADAAMILLQDRAGFRLGLRVNPITSRVSLLEFERQ
jgi:type II secretion system protein H